MVFSSCSLSFLLCLFFFSSSFHLEDFDCDQELDYFNGHWFAYKKQFSRDLRVNLDFRFEMCTQCSFAALVKRTSANAARTLIKTMHWPLASFASLYVTHISSNREAEMQRKTHIQSDMQIYAKYSKYC